MTRLEKWKQKREKRLKQWRLRNQKALGMFDADPRVYLAVKSAERMFLTLWEKENPV